MNGIPGEFPLPRTAFAQQRALLAAHVETQRAGSSRGRRFALTVAVAACAVVLAAAAALAVRVFVLDKGFVGLPPNGATPSTPESGRLVASLAGRSTTNENLALVYLYADGRLIWARHEALPDGANPVVTGLLEQRLTSEGVERMLSRLVSTGLFDHDVALVSDRFIWGHADVRAAHRLIGVDWSRPDTDLADPDSPDRVTATPDQERGLERLDALLAHPTRGLPASAWAERGIRAYVPSMFAVCWDSSPARVSDPQSDPSRVLSQLPPAARDLLVGKKSTRRRGKRGWAGGPYYPSATDCADVTTAEARFLSRALAAAGIERTDPPAGLQYSFGLRGGTRETAGITFEPLLPNGESTSFRTG